jgi:hypothetical protein
MQSVRVSISRSDPYSSRFGESHFDQLVCFDWILADEVSEPIDEVVAAVDHLATFCGQQCPDSIACLRLNEQELVAKRFEESPIQ